MIQMEMFSNSKEDKKANTFHKAEEKKFPQINFESLLSDRFIEQNGMFCMRSMIKQARNKKDWRAFLKAINAEIEIKKGKNTIKNNIKHIYLNQNLLP